MQSGESGDMMGKEERKDKKKRWALKIGTASLKILCICLQG